MTGGQLQHIFAMPAALDWSVRHKASVTLWLPVWLPADPARDLK
jgi:hypothetical protein